MPVIRRRGWEMKESLATPESGYLNRRSILAGMGFGAVSAATAGLALPRGLRAEKTAGPAADLYPVERNTKYTLERELTPEKIATTYNNFYEFGSHKNIWKRAQDLQTEPWKIVIDGLVEQKIETDFDTLVRKMPLEERLYRHRCVEAWSMRVPYSGFQLSALLDYAKPLGSAKYLVMETFKDTDVASGQKQFWYPWPYTEGLTMAEARNELSFIATGLYGKPIPKQNGAPLRLATPWKYGFKHVKSIVRFSFTEERPISFWEELIPKEYGFFANVNPGVPHRRWSQKTERDIGTGERIRTEIYNGYGEYVADLYAGMDQTKIFY